MEDTKTFFKEMIHQWEGSHAAVVVLDNHPAHNSNLVRDFADSHGLDMLRLPTCSSALNPVERVWSVLKHHWATELAILNGQKTDESIADMVTRVIDTKMQMKMGRIHMSANGDFRRVLKGELI